MKINSVNTNYNNSFGATPNRILYDYIQKSLPKNGAPNAADLGLQIMKRLDVIDEIFVKKPLNMLEGAKRYAAINLDDTFLTQIDKNAPIISNLDIIINSLKGRLNYLKWRSADVYNKRIEIDSAYIHDKALKHRFTKDVRKFGGIDELK